MAACWAWSIAVWLFCRRQKLNLLPVADLVCALAPIGLFFGRIANFVNGELWGRVTNVPWAMVFPRAGDLPRHPSQLYEAATEGLLLFVILQICLRVLALHRRPGLLTAIFSSGLWHLPLHLRIFPRARCAVPGSGQHGHGAVHSGLADGGRLVRARVHKQAGMSAARRSEARIADLIAAQGPISVAQYMTLALHDPQGGYYATRDPFGAAAISSPRRKSARCSAKCWACGACRSGTTRAGPNIKRLVELGPGRGTLMADVLRAAKVAPEFLADLEVVLIEASPVLQQVQAEKLQGQRRDNSLAGAFR